MKYMVPIHLAIAILNLAALATTAADAPRLLPFQGRLTDSNGNAVPDGAKLVQFQIYGEPSGGSALWAGEVHRATVNGGLVNVLLGSKNPFPDTPAKPFFDRMLYLQITVDANNDKQITAADPPLLPRQVILPALFAKESGNSGKLGGSGWDAILLNGATNPVTAKIDGRKIADETISSAQIAPQGIEADDLGPTVTQKFDDIAKTLVAIQTQLAKLEASMSACCGRLDSQLQDLKVEHTVLAKYIENPWVLYANKLSVIRSLSNDDLQRWEYAVDGLRVSIRGGMMMSELYPQYVAGKAVQYRYYWLVQVATEARVQLAHGQGPDGSEITLGAFYTGSPAGEPATYIWRRRR